MTVNVRTAAIGEIGLRRMIIWGGVLAAVLLGVSAVTADNHFLHKGVEMASKSQSNQSLTRRPGIVLIGASYAEGLELAAVAGRPILNKGVGGEQSFEMLARFQTDVIDQKPQAVIMWGFINDIFRADRAQIPAAIERIKTSYREMVRLAQANGIVPILATEVTMGPRGGFKERVVGWIAGLMGKTSYQAFINRHVLEVNSWLKTYAADQSLQVLDLQQLLAEEEGALRQRRYAQEDGSHISVQGYAAIVAYLQDVLATPMTKGDANETG